MSATGYASGVLRPLVLHAAVLLPLRKPLCLRSRFLVHSVSQVGVNFVNIWEKLWINDKYSAACKTIWINSTVLINSSGISLFSTKIIDGDKHQTYPNFRYSGPVKTDGDLNIFYTKGFFENYDCLCPPQPFFLGGGGLTYIETSDSHTFSQHNICTPDSRFTGFVSDHLSAVLFSQSARVTTSKTSLFISDCNLSKSLINAASLFFPLPSLYFLLNQCKTKSSITKESSPI